MNVVLNGLVDGQCECVLWPASGLLWPAVALPWPAASPCLALCLSFSLLLLPLWLPALPSSGVVSDADGK